MRYKWLKENEIVLDVEINTSIPVNNGTAEAIKFAAWLAAGNTPDAADPEPQVLKYVSKKQMFERLKAIGKDEVVWNALTVSQQLEFMNLEEGILTNDALVIGLLTACGIEPSSILY